MTTCSSVSIVNFEHVITVWEYSSTVNNIKRYDDRDMQNTMHLVLTIVNDLFNKKEIFHYEVYSISYWVRTMKKHMRVYYLKNVWKKKTRRQNFDIQQHPHLLSKLTFSAFSLHPLLVMERAQSKLQKSILYEEQF